MSTQSIIALAVSATYLIACLVIGMYEGEVAIEIAVVAVEHRTGVENQYVARLCRGVAGLLDDIPVAAGARRTDQIRGVVYTAAEQFDAKRAKQLGLGEPALATLRIGGGQLGGAADHGVELPPGQ